MAEWKIWGAPNELSFEYIDGDKHAFVSFGLDGLGYALRRGNKFESGKFTADDPPSIANEINAYLLE